MDLQGKQVRAVKRVAARLHHRQIRAKAPFRVPSLLSALVRICFAVLCRRGTAPMHAGLFQHISGI
jgi:hypothetical protein